ncbi:hypothetical protein T01_8432 [Trichinella spiralis]|uniref:Uncharacterized protein n=1 Tax=Trichinella spiralis TaxID=6334 RepID=A0A0V1APT7_TRISP|nr:hypothetical protein T01_8432 [Trichinella spiralis]
MLYVIVPKSHNHNNNNNNNNNDDNNNANLNIVIVSIELERKPSLRQWIKINRWKKLKIANNCLLMDSRPFPQHVAAVLEIVEISFKCNNDHEQ